MNEKEAIEKAVLELQSKNVILCPSDTIYGLSCDATSEEAVEKIIQLKNRPSTKSFIVLVNSTRMINQCIKDMPEVAWDLIDLAEKPLTLVLEGTNYVAKNARNEDGTIGIRMVKSGSCFELLKRFNKPIISTSPNVSGEPTPESFEKIAKEIKENVSYVFPNKMATGLSSSPSRIVKLNADGEVLILRK